MEVPRRAEAEADQAPLGMPWGGGQADGRAQGTELRWGGCVSLEESPLELAFHFWFPQQSEPRNGFEKPQGDLSSLVPH